jgi:hypothetical protein
MRYADVESGRRACDVRRDPRNNRLWRVAHRDTVRNIAVGRAELIAPYEKWLFEIYEGSTKVVGVDDLGSAWRGVGLESRHPRVTTGGSRQYLGSFHAGLSFCIDTNSREMRVNGMTMILRATAFSAPPPNERTEGSQGRLTLFELCRGAACCKVVPTARQLLVNCGSRELPLTFLFFHLLPRN